MVDVRGSTMILVAIVIIMKRAPITLSAHGFTLNEVLTAFSIMFLTVAIALPVFALCDDFQVQRDKSNARQMIAFNDAAKLQGVNFVVGGAPLPTVIRMAQGSTVVRKGGLKPLELKLNSFTPAEIESAVRYLMVEAGTLKLASDTRLAMNVRN